MKFYSPSINAFYDSAFHGERTMRIPDPAWAAPEDDADAVAPLIEVPNPDCRVPEDAVEISDEEHAAIFEGQAIGKDIVAGPDGKPALADRPPPSPEESLATLRYSRDKILLDTDGIVARHRDEKELGGKTTLAAADYSALLVYRQQLRQMPDVTDPANPVWPAEPAFLKG